MIDDTKFKERLYKILDLIEDLKNDDLDTEDKNSIGELIEYLLLDMPKTRMFPEIADIMGELAESLCESDYKFNLDFNQFYYDDDAPYKDSNYVKGYDDGSDIYTLRRRSFWKWISETSGMNKFLK